MTAFDLTFSAPKLASVLYALGDPAVSAAVEAAFTAAVEQAIASLSPRIAHTRTGHAGAAVVDTDGVLGVSYRHHTSRALDPQLHDHILISNAVLTLSDGEWRTLDARGLYRNAKASGVEFQSFFRSALGEWTAGFVQREGRNPTSAEIGKAQDDHVGDTTGQTRRGSAPGCNAAGWVEDSC